MSDAGAEVSRNVGKNGTSKVLQQTLRPAIQFYAQDRRGRRAGGDVGDYKGAHRIEVDPRQRHTHTHPHSPSQAVLEYCFALEGTNRHQSFNMVITLEQLRSIL